MRNLHLELEKQRALLCRLAVQGLLRGESRAPSDEVLAQSRKVDALLASAGRGGAAGGKKRKE